MAIYSYVKSKPVRKKNFITILSFGCIVTGISMLIWVLFPIIQFELLYAPKFGSLLEPVSGSSIISETFAASTIPTMLRSDTIDYTKASVWFPKASQISMIQSKSTYSLKIPKVGISDAIVAVGGDDLTKNLIQFAGPMPGQIGNPVIFGHSTLTWLYNPKVYTTIFTKLPDLSLNDEIFATVDGITYRFKIYEMKVVSPDTLSVLDQQKEFADLTLVTCVPPGTYFKRLVIKARLQNL